MPGTSYRCDAVCLVPGALTLMWLRGAGVVNAAGVCMLDMAPKEAEVEWEQEGTHGRSAGICLRSAPSSKGGYGILLSCSDKTELR